jgi:hypothetical protein
LHPRFPSPFLEVHLEPAPLYFLRLLRGEALSGAVQLRITKMSHPSDSSHRNERAQ